MTFDNRITHTPVECQGENFKGFVPWHDFSRAANPPQKQKARLADLSLLNLFYRSVGHNKCHFRTGCDDISPYLWQRACWKERISIPLRPDRLVRSRVEPIARSGALRKASMSSQGLVEARGVAGTRMAAGEDMLLTTAI